MSFRDPLSVFSFLKASMGRIRGVFPVHKFGEADSLPTGSFSHVWDGNSSALAVRIPDPPYDSLVTPTINTISSSDSGDTNRLVMIEGLDTDRHLVTQEIRTNGQSKVTLQVPLVRVNEMWNSSARGVDILGNLYCYEDTAIVAGVPTDTTKVGAIIRDGLNQTQMAMYTVPKGHTLYATHGWATVSKSGGATAVAIEMRIQIGHMDLSKRQLHKTELLSHGGSQNNRPYLLPIPIPEQVDLHYICRPSHADLSMAAGFHGIVVLEDEVNGQPPRYVDEFGTITWLYQD